MIRHPRVKGSYWKGGHAVRWNWLADDTALPSLGRMAEKPIAGSTGDIAWKLPSPYLPHGPTGLLHLPRFLAKIRLHLAGTLPESYRKNFCRGLDRFLCMHLGIDPSAVVQLVDRADGDQEQMEAGLRQLLPENVRAHVWNRELVQKGMTPAGREFLLEALTAMGCPERASEVRSICDLIELDEGRIPGFVERPDA